jgi:hypothetical protein
VTYISICPHSRNSYLVLNLHDWADILNVLSDPWTILVQNRVEFCKISDGAQWFGREALSEYSAWCIDRHEGGAWGVGLRFSYIKSIILYESLLVPKCHRRNYF